MRSLRRERVARDKESMRPCCGSAGRLRTGRVPSKIATFRLVELQLLLSRQRRGGPVRALEDREGNWPSPRRPLKPKNTVPPPRPLHTKFHPRCSDLAVWIKLSSCTEIRQTAKNVKTTGRSSNKINRVIPSVLAILAGLAVIVVTSFGIEFAVNPLLMRMFPAALPDEAAMSHTLPAWLFTFAYTFVCVVAGGYVTARLAARFPVRHAVVLGLVQSALTIPAMLAFPDKAPLWSWIGSMVVVIPAAWWGGLLCASHQPRLNALA